MTTDTLFNTREEWLSEAINECRAIFANENAGTIPDGVKVSCGFPLSAKRAKHASIGECWAPARPGCTRREGFPPGRPPCSARCRCGDR